MNEGKSLLPDFWQVSAERFGGTFTVLNPRADNAARTEAERFMGILMANILMEPGYRNPDIDISKCIGKWSEVLTAVWNDLMRDEDQLRGIQTIELYQLIKKLTNGCIEGIGLVDLACAFMLILDDLTSQMKEYLGPDGKFFERRNS